MELTRDIPIPKSISEHAQAVMEAGCAGVPDRLANPPELPELSDTDGWKERVAMTDEMMVFAFADRVDESALTTTHLDVAGVHVVDIVPQGAPTGEGSPLLLDIHGGALVGGGGEAGRLLSSISAARAGLRTWAVDYRMPPDHPFPTPLDDCFVVYRELLAHTPPERVVVAGASAGGNLAAAMLLHAREAGLPMPAALVLLSPEVDLTESGDTFATNVGVDYVLLDGLGASIALYAGDHDLTDPLLSPLFGDLTGFPPTFLQSGTRDLFLSNTVRMHRALRGHGVDAELHVWEAMPHGGFFGAPEDDEITRELRAFLSGRINRA
jgi:epsilon-lactone hydrolase